VKKREKEAPYRLERVKECLKRVVDYAATKNVRLGVEGRRGYEEMPNEKELPDILDELRSPFCGLLARLRPHPDQGEPRLPESREWLRLIGPRAFGCHLQDVIWPGQDHQPPFFGHVDLDN
jgi:hypothetical protein